LASDPVVRHVPDPAVFTHAETDLAPLDRLQVHLAFGDAELSELRRLCEQHRLRADVVLRMLELEQTKSGMGKRRGLRPQLRELVEELSADGGAA